jgi:hypothetical protein
MWKEAENINCVTRKVKVSGGRRAVVNWVSVGLRHYARQAGANRSRVSTSCVTPTVYPDYHDEKTLFVIVLE